MKKTIAYAIVKNKRYETIIDGLDTRYYIFKFKTKALRELEKDEKVIKVEIKEVK